MQLTAVKFAGTGLACLALCVSACSDPQPIAAVNSSTCGNDGALVAEIYGGIRASIDWDATTLACEGMPRPNGKGARLRFAGAADRDRQIAFILGLPDLIEGETAKEIPTNVTLLEEGTGHFFGTGDATNCWTDVDKHEQLQEFESPTYRISGILYCVAPLAELNGSSSISFADLKFTGRLDWKQPK